jgi:hypothetical protein
MKKAMDKETDPSNGKMVRYSKFTLETKREMTLAMIEDMMIRETSIRATPERMNAYLDRIERLWTNRTRYDL